MIFLEGKLLDKSDLTLLRAYTLKVEDGITNATFNKLHSHSLKPHLIQSNLQKSEYSSSLGSNPCATAAALTHASALLAHTRHCGSAQNVTLTATKLMG